MHEAQRKVEQFHHVMDLPIGDLKTPKISRGELRAKLILEEAGETAHALTGEQVVVTLGRPANPIYAEQWNMDKPNFLGSVDGLCDLLVVTYGTAVEMQVDLQPFFDEVHDANMRKAGGPVREDGKKLKPPGWEPPDLAKVLAEESVKHGTS